MKVLYWPVFDPRFFVKLAYLIDVVALSSITSITQRTIVTGIRAIISTCTFDTFKTRARQTRIWNKVNNKYL